MVRGYQGEGLTDPTAILATAKHFAGYSETQGGRDASEADISRRKLRSWFLPPFERVAREGCRTFMLGYQSMDGVPITINDWLLSDVLRGEWGYTGTLITDWDNVGRMVWEQKVQPDYAHAAAAAVKAGNDMVMTTPKFYEGALEAVAQGLLSSSDFDTAVSRILTLKFDLGLFENPRLPGDTSVIGAAEHTALNLDVARRSLVLLENDGTLPLASPATIAVVGPLADDAQYQLGDWAGSSGQGPAMDDGHPREMITTVLDGVRRFADVSYARGADILTVGTDPAGAFFPDGQPRPQVVLPSAPSEELIAEAVAVAESSDAVVAVVGDQIELVGEGRSTATLELVGGQNALLDALIETGKPVIVVVIASKPLVLPASVQRAAGVVWAANPGMRGGQAIAELLFGEIEPSGRLPISFARHAGQQPTYYNQLRGQHGDRYADLTQSPAWAFGEGLSYTTVSYDRVVLASSSLAPDDTIVADVTVSNTGSRPVRETVQVYVRDEVTSVSWTDKELKAHTQVDLAPGETRTVRIELPVAECTIVDAAGNRVVEAGGFALLVGPSSRDEALLQVPFEVK
jgi:beta-glucosidase